MKKPTDYMTLPAQELTKLIHDLNVWNANQPVTESVHNRHYTTEIQPLVRRRDNLNAAWAAGLLKEYEEYTERRLAYSFSVDDFGLWHSWYLHNKK